MRIFYSITKLGIGGAQTHILQLSEYFISKGNEVAVMSSPNGELENAIKSIGADFYPNDFFSNKINPIKDLKAIKKIKKAIKDFKPDLISCHSSKAGFLTRLAVRNKIPTIFTAHGWGFTYGVPMWRRFLMFFLEKIASKYCSEIICVSDFDRNLALKYKIASQEKMVTIHNGVEIQTQIPSYAQNNLKKESSKNNTTQITRIIFVGRLEAQKDPMLLLKAFNDLPNELKNKAEIFIVGEGPKRTELERFIKSNELDKKIILLGGISRVDVFEFLKKSDIFILTSNWEGFPRSILEAMSCGLAVIASDVGGVSEAIKDCGILIQRGNKNGLVSALAKLLIEPEIVSEMKANSKKVVAERFSLDDMEQKTEKVYSKALDDAEGITKLR